MNKKSVIIKEKNPYEIRVLIDNIALINSLNGKSGLVNIKTNEIIGKLANYSTYYSENTKFYKQQKEIDDKAHNISADSETIRIYDALNEKMVVEGWKLSLKINCYLWILHSPIDNKLHIFDERKFRSDSIIFENGFDKVEILYEYCGKNYLVVTKDGKKGMYQENLGIVIPIEFDDIQKEKNIIILTKNNKKYFINDENYSLKSIECDEIIVNKNKNEIVYCKEKNTIYVYYNSYKTLELLSQVQCDKISYVGSDDSFYYFIFKNNNKFGVIKTVQKNNKDTWKDNFILLEAKYDEINYNSDDGIFYLKLKNKIGLYNSDYKNLIEPVYDKIEYLYNNLFAVYTGEFCDIIYLNKKEKNIVVKDCKITEKNSEGIIFEKDSLLGLLINHGRENIILEKYDKITHIGNSYFELEKDNKKGICRYGEIIIPIEYESIDHLCDKYYTSGNNLYFSLKKSHKCYEIAKTKYWYSSNEKIEFDNYYDEILLLPDVIAFKADNRTYIYNYDDKLLSVLPGNVKITVIEIGEYDKKILYSIDDVYYFYKDNKFEIAPVEVCDLYQTIYESTNGDVVVSSFNKKEHDDVCKKIEEGGEENIDDTISNIYRNNWNLRNNYPTLVKRLEPKKNMD